MALTSTATAPIDLLGAVNVLLNAVGSTSVMSLQDADMSEEAGDALTMISNTAVEVLSRGWHFNSEESYPIDPASDGSVTVPNNAVSVKVSAKSRRLDLAQRGLRLYNKATHSYDIGETVYVDMVLLFDFAEVPAPIRWYITAVAGKRFGVGRVPDGNTYRFTKEVEDEALTKALDFDMETRDRNLSESSEHFANMRRR